MLTSFTALHRKLELSDSAVLVADNEPEKHSTIRTKQCILSSDRGLSCFIIIIIIIIIISSSSIQPLGLLWQKPELSQVTGMALAHCISRQVLRGSLRPQGHSVAGRIMSMENSNDTIENRSRDLPVCSTVPQPLRHRVPHSKHVEALNS
jgi:hypothetical protein